MNPDQNQNPFEPIVAPVCRAHGLELVQVRKFTERGGAVLRVIIDRPGGQEDGSGVTLGDCQAVSRDLGPALDVNEAISGAYRLEVSSPGLDRPLVKLPDFERFAGKLVDVRTHTAQPDGRGGERRKFKGRLLGVDGDSIRLDVEGVQLALPFGQVARANVVYEY